MPIRAEPPEPSPDAGEEHPAPNAIGPFMAGDDWLWPVPDEDPEWAQLAGRNPWPEQNGGHFEPPGFDQTRPAPQQFQQPAFGQPQFGQPQFGQQQVERQQFAQPPFGPAQAGPWEAGPEEFETRQFRRASAPPADPRPSRPAQQGDRPPLATADGDEAWAMLAYFSSVCLTFVAPLVIYLIRRSRSAFSRAHAAQAVNLSFTALLYTLSILIIGGMLAMDTLMTGLITAGIVATVLWVTTLYHMARAVIAASSGTFVKVPGWLTAPLIKFRG